MTGAEPDSGEAAQPEQDEGLASVVHVDRHEDIATICGRIDTAPSYAVVLHAPKGNRALSREIGMRRLIRHTEENGKTIAFATSNGSLAGRARSLGIPVARKPEHVRWDAGGRVIWRIGPKSIAVPAIGRLLPAITLVVVAVALVGLVFTMGPSVDVVVYPPTETREEVITITASESFEEINLEELQVPARTVQSSRIVTVAVPTTGTATVGATPGQVTVTLTNNGDEEITVPAGTVVVAPDEGVNFETAEDITLAPGQSDYVAGIATEPGTVGNIPRGSIAGFEGDQFPNVTAVNSGVGAGGTDDTVPAVSSDDIATLRSTVDALETADSIRESIVEDRPGDAIFLDTATVDIVRGEPSATPGTPAEVVTMELRIGVEALAVVESVLDQIARETLAPGAETGEFIPGSVTAVETGARQVDPESGVVTTDFRVRGEFARGATSADIRDAVAGRSPEGARSTLQERYGIDDAEVDLWPGWAPRLPRFDFRIDVQFQAQPDDDLQSPATAEPTPEPDDEEAPGS